MTTRDKVERLLDRLSDEELAVEYTRLQAAMAKDVQPTPSVIGMFSSGRSDLSARAADDEFEPRASH